MKKLWCSEFLLTYLQFWWVVLQNVFVGPIYEGGGGERVCGDLILIFFENLETLFRKITSMFRVLFHFGPLFREKNRGFSNFSNYKGGVLYNIPFWGQNKCLPLRIFNIFVVVWK